MNITLWGVRGSIPTLNPESKMYGGHTSCIEVEENGHLLVLDAGSGIQNLNQSPNLESKRIDILLTHLHIDHIQGLGFFKPLFNPAKEVHIWGPRSSMQSLRARLGRYFSPPLFPVYFRNLTCQLIIHEIANDDFAIGPFSIKSEFIVHPGPTVGYRIESSGKVFTYIPDHEPVLGATQLHHNIKWISGSTLASGADILLHDAQYTIEEYQTKVGWGHSAMEHTLQFAELTKVKHLFLMHHDPSHTDAQLDAIYKRLKETTSFTYSFEMAVEGSKIHL